MPTVIGIDPGSRVTGYAVVHGEGSRIRLLAGGNIRIAGEGELSQRLVLLRRRLLETIAELEPDSAAIETVFSGVNPQALIRLSHARGVVLESLAAHGLPIREFTPQQIKRAVSGHGRADKAQIQQLIGRFISGAEQLPRDAADAAAVAFTALSGHGLEKAIARSRLR